MLDRMQQASDGNSIFSDEIEASKSQTPSEAGKGTTPAASKPAGRTRAGASLDPAHSARALDPDPRARVRWERKMVIRSMKASTNPFAQEPRDLRISRTERRYLSKSRFLPTSLKKLVHLARQIQGKTVDDAIVQMRYSKKKQSRPIINHLKKARDLAIVERGMGIGNASGETPEWRNEVQRAASVSASAAPGEHVDARGKRALTAVNGSQGQVGVKIQTKDKRWLVVDNPTRLYVAEAWIGRGPRRHVEVEYRARGRRNLLISPSTSEFLKTLYPFAVVHILIISSDRHYCRLEGGENTGARTRRARGQEVSTGAMGTSAQQECRWRSSALLLVAPIRTRRAWS
jgi:ribosomal protein L22